MSGIGKHKFKTNNNSIWDPDIAICPYCGHDDCYADFCDVGVGLVQCGPYHCESCGAIEIGAYDKKLELSIKEVEFGWYEPNRMYEGCANNVNGTLIYHKLAKKMYELGLLKLNC